MNDNEKNISGSNWIPVIGSIIGAIIGNVPGALIGGVIGAILKEFTCPNCGCPMENIERNLWRCKRCNFHTYRE